MRRVGGECLIAFTVLTAAIAPAAFAAKLTDKEHTSIDEPRPADVPSDAALEAAGAVIGRVEIAPGNIFDESDPREKNGLFRLADHLHIRTKHATIRAQLLFASGDKYLARKLAETERALRLLPYVYDARIVPVHYADGKVDIRVITKDVWTLSPGISFARSGGTNDTKFNLQDTNFLGWGKTLQISRGSTFDRTISRYNLGNIVDQFNDSETSYELSGGVSNGLIDGWVKRWTFGMRYDRNLFLPAPITTLPARRLPPDRAR